MKRTILFLLTILGSLISQAWVVAQSQEPEFVKLATLNNAIGGISEISDDGHLLVMANRTDTVEMQLINVFTGEVIYKGEANESLRLSPDQAHYIMYRNSPKRSQLIELSTGKLIYETDRRMDFRATGSYAVVTDYSLDTSSMLIETATGRELLTMRGLPGEVSFDGRYATEINKNVNPFEVNILEIETGRIHQHLVASESAPEEYLGNIFVWTLFTRDSEDLTIYSNYIGTLVVDVETGRVRFSVIGGVTLTRDSKYMLNNSDDDYGNVQLIDIESGRVLYEVQGGALYLGAAYRYLLRKEGYDVSDWQVIDLESGDIVFEFHGWFSPTLIKDDTQLALWDAAERTTKIIDLETGATIREFEGAIDSQAYCNSWYVIWRDGTDSELQLVDENFDNVLLTARQIEIADSCDLVFASNGMGVDVYGKPEMQEYFK